MNLLFIAPLASAVLLAITMGHLANRLNPRHSARLCALSLVSILVAAWTTSLALGLSYLAHLPLADQGLTWCRQTLGMHHPPPAPVGMSALLFSTIGAIHIARIWTRWRTSFGTKPGHVHIVDSEQAYAFAQPGPHGGIVLSTGMIAALRANEHRVVLAHEQSHLNHRHDRYLLVAQSAQPILLLRRLARQLQLAVERWADEDAATIVRDRKLVARALARAAIASTAAPAHRMAATGSNVPYRVAALISPTTPRRSWTTTAAGMSVGCVLAGIIQLHHLVPVLDTLSRH